MQLLNPFSISLEKPPFMEVKSNPVFAQGDYKVYKYYDRHYIHTYKNIVIGERCAVNKDLINNLVNDTQPENETQLYFDYQRGKWAKEQGIEAAKKLNFKII